MDAADATKAEHVRPHCGEEALGHRPCGMLRSVEEQDDLVIDTRDGIGAAKIATNKHGKFPQERGRADVARFAAHGVNALHERRTHNDTAHCGRLAGQDGQLVERNLSREIVGGNKRAGQRPSRVGGGATRPDRERRNVALRTVGRRLPTPQDAAPTSLNGLLPP